MSSETSQKDLENGSKHDATLAFGPFVLQQAGGRLLLDGQPVALTPKAYEALLLLVRQPGHLVSKEAFLAALWPDAFVEEANLTSTIWMVRKALKGHEQWIETVPKRGYRFIGPVEAVRAAAGPQEPIAPVLDVVPPSPVAAEVDPRRWLLAAGSALALAALLAVGVVGWASWSTQGSELSSAGVHSVAVLTLEDLSQDRSQQFLADGLTEALIDELARSTSLRVTSRTSSAQVERRGRRLRDIASSLGVDAVVEGAVIRSGDSVRVTARLVDGVTDRHLWSGSYDGDLTDILTLERRVALSIGEEVRAAIMRSPTARAPVNARAQEHYLRGRELYYRGINTPYPERETVLRAAIGRYRDALAIEPGWADAYAASAQAGHWMSEVDPPRLFHAAREDALRAIELDDTVAEGHGALAYVSAAYFRDFETAEREFRRAVALNPQTAYRHGFGMALTALGRFDEAQAMFERARQMDPLNVPLAINAARSLFMARRFEEAATALRALGVGQGAWALTNLSESAARAGHVAEALRVARSLVGSSLDAVERSSLVCALAQGPADEARRELMALFEVSGGHGVSSQPYPAARAHACLGDRETALANLERAFRDDAAWLANINVDPAYDPIRSDPRFRALVSRLGLGAPPAAIPRS